MAEVTAQLVWYRLAELSSSLSDRLWGSAARIEILDMLFLGWIIGAFLVIIAINVYIKVFGLPRILGGGQTDGVAGGGRLGNATRLFRGGESADWITVLGKWLYEGGGSRPNLITTWLKAIADEANKSLRADIQIRIDNVQLGASGSPFKFSNIVTDGTPSRSPNVTVHTNVELTDVRVSLSVICQSSTNLQVDPCHLRIVKLKAPMKIVTSRDVSADSKNESSTIDTKQLKISLSLSAQPDIKLEIIPGSYVGSVDTGQIERALKEGISRANLCVDLCTDGATSNNTDVAFSRQSTMLEPDNFGSLMTQGSRSAMVKRLLVKIIKANGLRDRNFTHCDPYVCVAMNEPRQNYQTSVVKNTANPFFDEHFVFDFNASTTKLKFSAYDHLIKSSDAGTGVVGGVERDECLGEAMLSMEEVRQMPSTRQIIPLLPATNSYCNSSTAEQQTRTAAVPPTTSTTASVTVECLMMEVPLLADEVTNGLSCDIPYRRIDTQLSHTPGGTLITTTTTTSEIPLDYRGQPILSQSPTPVQKSVLQHQHSPRIGASNTLSVAGAQGRHLTNGRGENLTEAALRELSRNPHSSATSATVVISGVQKTSQPLDDLSHSGSPALPPKGSETPRRRTLASQLRKRFGPRKKSDRSHSADKARGGDLGGGGSVGSDGLLKPPSGEYSGSTQLHHGEEFSDSSDALRKARSHSLSSSFRNLFKKKKKNEPRIEGGASAGGSCDSSLSRVGTGGRDYPSDGGRNSPTFHDNGEFSLENSTAQASPAALPRGSIARHNTPVAPGDQGMNYSLYSTSVPAQASPLAMGH